MSHAETSPASALAANTAVQLVGKAVSITMGVIVVGLMTRLLGTEGFGKYSTANTFLQVFAILMDLGLNVMLVQMLGEQAGNEKEEHRIVSALFTLRVLMGAAVFTIGTALAWLIPTYDLEIKLAVVGLWISFFFTLLNQTVIGVQQRHLKMHVVAIAEVAGRATLLAGMLIAIAHGWGLLPVTLIVSLGGVMGFAINIAVARHYASFRWNMDVPLWMIALKRSWPIAISILFSLIYFRADLLILGWVRSQAEVGVYGAAYRVLEILVSLPYMYGGVLLPMIAKQWKDGAKEKFRTFIQRSFDAMALVTFPMLFGTFAVATPAMTLVAGSQFGQSGDVLRILILATAAIFMATVFSHAVVALDAQKDMLPWYIWTAVFAVIAYAIFIPRYGMWAAAWLTVATEIAVLVGNIIVVIRHADLPLNISVASKAFIASIALFAVAWALEPYSLFAAIAGSALVYVLLTFAMKALTPEIVKELIRTRRGVPEKELV
jgi:O-antigen/teichoic acid export membrane protein